MPQGFDKSAGVVVKNFDEFVNTLKNAGKLRNGHTAEQVAKDVLYGKAGSGSVLFDYGTKVFGKKFGAKIRNGYGDVQKRLANIDIRTGSKIHDMLQSKNEKSKILAAQKLKEFKAGASQLSEKDRKRQLKSILRLKNHGKIRSKIGESFVFKHEVPLEESAKGVANKSVEVGVPGVTVPLEKAKKVALPFAGAMYISSKLTDAQSEKENQGGDGKMGAKKESHTREELMEKISSALFGESVAENDQCDAPKKLDIQKIASLTMTASRMLKYAADENKKMKLEIEKLSSDNKRLSDELFIRNRTEKATKLANLMNTKQMIKKADITAQVDQLIHLDDEAFDMLKTAVENVSVESSKNGIDNLTFLGETYNINNVRDNKKQTLADSLEDAIHEKS